MQGRAVHLSRAEKSSPVIFPFEEKKAPTHEGLPYKGTPFLRKENDPEQMQPQKRLGVKIRIFDFSKPEDVADYEAINSKIGDGLVVVSKEEWQWKDGTCLSCMRWVEPYFTTPPALAGKNSNPVEKKPAASEVKTEKLPVKTPAKKPVKKAGKPKTS